LSFFDDDEGGSPRPAAASTRTRTQPRRPQRSGPGHDRHTLMVRRRIAAGAGVVLLIVIALVVNGCLKSGKEAALKEYNSNASQLVGESDQQVAHPLFETLAGASGKSALDVEEEVDQLRQQAQTDASHAAGLSVPGEMEAAQRNLLLAFNLRAEGLAKIANLVRTALSGQNNKQASSYIAGAMELFLTSDVLWSQRVAPLIQQALASGGVQGQSTASTQFLPNLGWLEPSTVLARLTGQATGSAPNQITPGTHGSALIGASVGSTNLEPPPALNQIAAGAKQTFTVKVEDSGSNPETDVKVEVAVAAGGKQYKASQVIGKTEPGVTSSVNIPVEGIPQGVAATVTVNVQPVPGETNVENNKGTYHAIFG
jgi:hypothetical protein